MSLFEGPCPICGGKEELSGVYELTLHVLDIHMTPEEVTSAEGYYYCAAPDCKEKDKVRAVIARHILAIHCGERPELIMPDREWAETWLMVQKELDARFQRDQAKDEMAKRKERRMKKGHSFSGSYKGPYYRRGRGGSSGGSSAGSSAVSSA